MFTEAIIRHADQFPNVPSPVRLSRNVDVDGSMILRGIMVKLYHQT